MNFYSRYCSFHTQNNDEILNRGSNSCIMLASGIPIPFQVNTLPNIEVIRQNVFTHAKVMAIDVGGDLKLKRIVCFVIFVFCFCCCFLGVETGYNMDLS